MTDTAKYDIIGLFTSVSLSAMAIRKTTLERKNALAEGLRTASHDGRLRPGDMLPTVRKLSEQYQLSVRIVAQELQKLVDEGVLYTIPRVGNFVGQSGSHSSHFYLLMTGRESLPDSGAPHNYQVRIGFEERIAQLGGASLIMPVDSAVRSWELGEMPHLSGVFDFSYNPILEENWTPSDDLQCVRFAVSSRDPDTQQLPNIDLVRFDDFNGGCQAAEHLIQRGHRRIAFLGFHDQQSSSDQYYWSTLRAAGWAHTMKRSSLAMDDLSFLPAQAPKGYDDEIRVAREVAEQLIGQADITAVIGANDHAVLGLFDRLRETRIDGQHWPSAVGFDNMMEAQNYVLTSLRLPWENIGRAAADLLWERKTGRIVGAVQERIIKMKLISRLTSRKGSMASTHKMLQAATR